MNETCEDGIISDRCVVYLCTEEKRGMDELLDGEMEMSDGERRGFERQK